MAVDVVAQIAGLSHDDVRPVVRSILGADATPFGRLAVRKIGRSVGYATEGIVHVTGQARTLDEETSWTAVVKILGELESRARVTEDDPYRELEVYRSGAFEEVRGGVRSARCYAIQDRGAHQLLWLEDLSDAPQPPWQARHFLETARHLGRFNANWPSGALPEWDWLSRHGFQAEFTRKAYFQKVFERFPTNKDHPHLRAFAPPPAAEALIELWEQCDALLVEAERTHKGICHLDCHPKNLFPMTDPAGESYTVAIDWVKVGVANLGIDVGHLLASPMTWLEITPDEAIALRDPMIGAYVAGLSEAGWSGDEAGVRLTYLTRVACEAIRHTVSLSHSIKHPEWAEGLEKLLGRPMSEISARYGGNLDFYLDCKDEAIRLARQAG